MLDIQFIRENPQVVKKAASDKQLDPSVVDQLLTVDKERRELQAKVDKVRKQINQNATAIKEVMKNKPKPPQKLIDEGKKLKNKLREIEPNYKKVKSEYDRLMMDIPNVPAEDVPIGPDESGNVVSKTVGKKPKFKFEPKPHHVLMEKLNMLDSARAVKLGGFRSYFLKNDGLLLEIALLQYALNKMVEAGFEPMSAPVLVNEETMWGTGYFPWGKEDHYLTQDEQFLTGTSEVALTAYRSQETLREEDLPIKMTGLSPCFRREVGAHGKDTQGVIRVHQFNKVEQVVYTVADEEVSRKWHKKMLNLAETMLQDLELPYQVLTMCTGDMGAGQRKKYDIETWFPAQDQYRETHSASYFNDFQSRRLNIKYQAKDGQVRYVYTLNNTMAATPRLLAALVENHQQEDGSIKVPKALKPWMKKDFITL